jgi:hypothetical protein
MFHKEHALAHYLSWLQYHYGFQRISMVIAPPLPEGYALVVCPDLLWFHWVSYEFAVSMPYADVYSAYMRAVANAGAKNRGYEKELPR